MPNESIYDDNSVLLVVVERDGAEVEIPLAQYIQQLEN